MNLFFDLLKFVSMIEIIFFLFVNLAQDNKIHAGRARYNGFVDAIRQIKVAEGWRGFYSGVGANFSGGVIAWGTYFYFYSSFKQFYSNKKQRFGVFFVLKKLKN